MVRSEFEVVVEACRMSQQDDPCGHRGKRGRRAYPRHLLLAVVYLSLREGWSLRQAEKWCKENFGLMRQHGWLHRNPPKKSTLHNVMREVNASTLQRISALVKHLRGEIHLPVQRIV